MNLGDLEFKAEDFIGYPIEGKQMLANLVNRLLTQRLEKAKQVFGYTPYEELFHQVTPGGDKGKKTTHSARLVCIEKIDSVKK